MNITRHVVFRSSIFNTKHRKEYFINDCCFGDDLALWLIGELRGRGFHTDPEPGQEDFGWYLNFSADGVDYSMLISYRPKIDGGEGDWMCSLERIPGVIGFFVGAAKRGIQIVAAKAIHGVLSSSPDITDIRWFTDEGYKTELDPKSEPAC